MEASWEPLGAPWDPLGSLEILRGSYGPNWWTPTDEKLQNKGSYKEERILYLIKAYKEERSYKEEISC